MKAIAANFAFAAFTLVMAGAVSAADVALTRIIECAPLRTGYEPLRIECPIVNGQIIDSECRCPTDHLMVDLNGPPPKVPPEYVSSQ